MLQPGLSLPLGPRSCSLPVRQVTRSFPSKRASAARERSGSIDCGSEALLAARSSVPAMVIAVLSRRAERPATCSRHSGAKSLLVQRTSLWSAMRRSESDAHNCGACAHDCEGAACALGLCAATIVAPGRAASAAGALATDGSIVYWHDNAAQQIMSLDLSKNDPSTVLASLANVSG